MIHKNITYCLLALGLIFFSFSAPARANNLRSFEWGTLLAKIKKVLPADQEYVLFTPAQKPKYSNRILGYIAAIDNKLLEKIIIMRIKTKPETDYLFVNNKLYSFVENWGTVDQEAVKAIRADLTKQFGEPQLQQDKNFYVYAFDSDRTKVLWYLIKLPDDRSNCKVYFYTKHLFRMLVTD